jgi:integrase/recombinase XerD
MKLDRHGQAAILSHTELQLLFNQGLTTLRDRTLFACQLFTGCRIAEACSLRTADVYNLQQQVRPKIIIRKGNTKGKLATRTIPVIEDLRLLLTQYQPQAGTTYLFPGRGQSHLKPDSADDILRKACQRVAQEGISTHSFRRTALTLMSDSGIPLRVIMEISGHRNLSQVAAYIEVREEQIKGAVNSLSLLSPLPHSEKCKFLGVPTHPHAQKSPEKTS